MQAGIARPHVSEFSLRIELHKATWEDYDKLHAALSHHSIMHTVPSNQGPRQLPTGTYWYDGPQNSGRAICDLARDVAARIKAIPAPWVFVAGKSDAGNMMWWGSNLETP